jgi:GNAT superfamily N-acetyltransferase
MTMKLIVDHIGSAYGQHDYVMRVMDADALAGALSFSEFHGTPHVNLISVDEDHRRRGVARMMIRNLQSRYEGVPIDFGYTTVDGTLMMAGLEFRNVPNQVYSDAEAERLALSARIAAFEAAAERLRTASGAERDAIMATIEEWNEVSDALDAADEIVAREPCFHRLVVLGDEEDELSGFVMNP